MRTLFEEILKLSTLSTIEYINIVGEYNHSIYGASIDPAIYKRGYTPEQLEIMKKRAIPRTIRSCNLSINRPLEEFGFEGFDYTFGLYSHYKTGHLPFDGPPSEQPARIIEIFNLYSQLEYEVQDRAAKEHKSNGK